MKILVTGGTGLAGSHSIRDFLQAGHEVRALVRSEAKLARVFPDSPRGLSSAVGDIADRSSVERALEGCDALLHAAAVVSIDNASPEALIEANLGGVQKVLGAALDAGVKRIVHVSTLSALFHVDANARAKPITPDTEPHESEHAYGRSKAMAERWVRERQAEETLAQVARAAREAGAHDDDVELPAVGGVDELQVELVVRPLVGDRTLGDLRVEGDGHLVVPLSRVSWRRRRAGWRRRRRSSCRW